MGHKKEDYLRFMSGAGRAPAPTMIRNINGHEGKVEAPVVRSQTFRLHAKETRALPIIVAGMYSIQFLFCFCYICYDYVIIICEERNVESD